MHLCLEEMKKTPTAGVKGVNGRMQFNGEALFVGVALGCKIIAALKHN